jgi:hypothetical protein
MQFCTPACGKKSKILHPRTKCGVSKHSSARYFGDSNRRSNGYFTVDVSIMPEVREIE